MSELKIESIQFDSAYVGQKCAGFLFYDPDCAPRFVLQITHGMCEYIMRYRPFAEFMVKNGAAVCGNDDLGHGATSGDSGTDGFFAPADGRRFVLEDIHTMNRIAHERWPGVPVLLMGHSMGSFFARWYSTVYPDTIDAALYCGTGGPNPAIDVAIGLTALIGKVKGPRHVSGLVQNMAFGSYQSRIPAAKTEYDWLSVDADNVQAYLADPKCGFLFTVSAMHELFCVVKEVSSEQWAGKVPQVPVLVFAGEEDPVGDYGKGPKTVYQRLRGTGHTAAQLKLYPGLRHEILNEIGKESVWQDVWKFCAAAANI